MIKRGDIVKINDHHPILRGLFGVVIDLKQSQQYDGAFVKVDLKMGWAPYWLAPHQYTLVTSCEAGQERAPITSVIKRVVPGELWDEDRRHPQPRKALTDSDLQFLKWECNQFK